MSDTPKSCEETDELIWPEREIAAKFRGVPFDAPDNATWLDGYGWQRASLPPQAAAVPARQDAAPGFKKWTPEEEQQKLQAAADALAHNDGSNNERNLVASLMTENLSALGAQTAVGEGELPRAIARMEEHRATKRGIILECPSMAEVLDFISTIRTQLRAAIAQRDEARKNAEWSQGRIRELAAIFGVCDGGRYLNDWLAKHDQQLEAAEAKLAAGFKEEELEKLEDMSRSGSFYAIAAYKRTIAKLISRLRSQESGQAGKAGENGE